MASFTQENYAAQTGVPSTSLHEDERELKRREENLARLVREVEKEKTKRDEVHARISSRRLAVASMRRVPVEVWKEIFLIVCLSEDTSSFHCYIDPGKRAATHEIEAYPLVLSSVCSYWRAIAVSFPQLWSIIEVHLHNLRVDIQKPLELFLANAKDHPLSIHIPCSPSGSNNDLARKVFQLLLKHLSRCGTVSLYVRGDYSMMRCAEPPTQSLPLLKTLYTDLTSVRHVTDTEDTFWFWVALRGAPLLKYIDISGFPMTVSLALGTPTPNHTPLSIKNLPLCTNIDTLTLRDYCRVKSDTPVNPRMRFMRPAEPSDDVEIPSLRRLNIESLVDAPFPKYLVSLFTWYIFPSLEELELDIRGPSFTPRTQFPPTFLPAFTRSTVELRKLTVKFADFPEKVDLFALFQFLKGTPSLTHLELNTASESGVMGASPTVPLLKSLTIPPNSSPGGSHLLKLEVLRIHDPEFDSQSQPILGVILNMLESRIRAIGPRTGLSASQNAPKASPLSEFSLTFCDASYCACGRELSNGLYGKLGFLKKVRPMEERGVKVVVRHIERNSFNLLEVQPKLDGIDWDKGLAALLASKDVA